MIPSSSSLLRALFLAASAAVHVVAFLVTGHPRPTSGGEASAIDVAVDEPVAAMDESRSAVAMAEPIVSRLAPTFRVVPSRGAHAPPPMHDLLSQGTPAELASPPQAEAVSAPLRFAFVVSTQSSPVGGVVSAQAEPPSNAHGAREGAPLAESDVSSPATLTGSLSPAYPPAARAQEVEADVVLSIVVSAVGSVSEVRVLRAAGYGFDDVAARAVRDARFVPARRDGQPVPVRMRWTVAFRLR